MTRSATIVLDTMPATDLGATLPLLIIGLALLMLGILVAGWAPIELSLGLTALGMGALARLTPAHWHHEEVREQLDSLLIASLITLVGFHVMG